ncbi:sodium-dependent transporter [Pelagibaculum spongiae]|uniref:Transporter n=1 Tax=Pelagibaculum spongiae TaxID=2080658 RepID=A0A2V1H6E7_9GAMM|nr:sodium-dependent transporter [Pelagibaculum spongiae]PVZ72002.1 sodium-dependent transporter [Pelagibaculum spongiae]
MSADSGQSIHGQWSNKWMFILAATGSAVGLGNIWKFPYITGENGGGAFVLVYLICISLVGIPIMVSEVLLGRAGKQSPINTMMNLGRQYGGSGAWSFIGYMGTLAGFLILSFYTVVAGWALAYVQRIASPAFHELPLEEIKGSFSALVSNPGELMLWHTLFALITTVVVARGVSDGIEKLVKYLMPLLFALLCVLLGYAATTGHFVQGLEFLFAPDFSKLSWDSVLVALGHSFFTLSLGMGAIMIYGSYLPKDINIGKTVVIIAGMDTLVALMAGMVIFPIVFANNMDPGAGPGLLFSTLTLAFTSMEFGGFFGTLFYLLVAFAGWTSAISLLEPGVSWLVENKNWSRAKSAWLVGLLCWVIGIGTVLSFNVLADFKIFDRTIFDNLDYLTANIMLPLGGLLIAVFASWFISREMQTQQLDGKGGLFTIWLWTSRVVAPGLVFVIFLNALGLLG